MKKLMITLALGVAGVTLLIALNAQMRRAAAAELALTEGTLHAVSEASEALEMLTLTLEKALVSASPAQYAAYLTDAALSADRAQRSLSELPDAQGQRSAVVAFLSDLSGQLQACLTALASGDSLSDADKSSLSASLSDLTLLQNEIALGVQELLTGEKLADALPATEVTLHPTAQELTRYKALPSEEIGSGMALQIAKEFVGVERVASVAHAPDTSGALPTFGVTIQTPDVQLNLEVTRQGGKVLFMVPETADFPVLKTPEDCAAAALAFLSSRGFPNMEALYYQVYDGLCVLTCAYVEQDVIVWADRVLVQVRMDTAEVVGIESRSFWQNHAPRKLQSPLLSESEARVHLSSGVTVQSARLCLLPTGSQERMCWQFTVTWGDGTYISYIDVLTGAELLLEKVIRLEMGSIAA